MPFDAPEASLSAESLAVGRCGCPVCTGQAVTTETAGDGSDIHAYLNADQRGGLTALSNGKISYTVDRAALQLTGFDPATMAPLPGWGGVAGRAFTVTYAYRAEAPSAMPDDSGGFSQFNAAQIVQAELAFQAWSDVANITFVRVGSGLSGPAAYSDSAAILLANYSTGVDGASAFAMYPGSTSAGAPAGDVWVNNTLSYNSAPTVGNYGGMVLVHEIGHAIGLAHPSKYDADGESALSYSANAGFYEDSRQYTVMSYFSETNTGGSYGGRYAAAPQLDDIAGAQLEYGANMNTRLGDTVYGFNATADRPWFSAASSTSRVVFAVWDAGGNDTFDFSGYVSNQIIDLRPGAFSNVGGLVGNVAVAMNVQIENARGGLGADVIHGNAGPNSLFGGGGNDTIDGGTGGSNYLRGDDGGDSIVGGAAFDDINGNTGDDTASGGLGDDWVVGGKDNDSLSGDAGGDLVYGNLGNDTLDGGAGDDIVRGGQDNDVLRGGDGRDFMAGDRGDDTMTGGAGADIFHSFAGAGVDRILDFNRAEGDQLQLLPGTIYAVSQRGADTVVMLGPSNEVVLVNVGQASLTGDWIVA